MTPNTHPAHTVSRQCRATYTETYYRDFYFTSTHTSDGKGRDEGKTHLSLSPRVATIQGLMRKELVKSRIVISLNDNLRRA
jgi:hypothetical protein